MSGASNAHSLPALECRFCAKPLRTTFVDLGMQPLSNAYVAADAANGMEHFYPLHARVCEACFLVQVPELTSPKSIFAEYAYLSSMSDSWLEHAKRYAETATARFDLGKKSLVVEVASNDGYLLQFFKGNGIPVLGIEPAANVAKIAESKGIPSLAEFFGTRLARRLVAEGRQADLLVGNNVLAHVPDLNDFVKGLQMMLAPAGVLTMEFPHLARLIAENQFDTIYHEHFSYFSFGTVERVFRAQGLRVFDVDELRTHGGSLRVYCQRAEGEPRPETLRVAALRAAEHETGLDRIETYAGFRERVMETKRRLLEVLIDRKRANKRIVAYGAAAKGNTLLNFCGIRTDFLDYVADRSPLKQGKLLPGTRIPIVAPERIGETKPDCVLILPWNIKEEVAAQLAHVRKWGGELLVPIPEPAVLP
jgi:C-methyltransferase C-terminal domain/Putative zinc binding domain/Methyltransferase domain